MVALGLDALRGRVPEGVVRALEEFLERLAEALDGDFEAYLFGSFARGDWLRDSDIDVIVVSRRLRGVPWHERYPMLRRLAPDAHPFDILAYTPEEFEELARRSATLASAARHWVRIYP